MTLQEIETTLSTTPITAKFSILKNSILYIGLNGQIDTYSSNHLLTAFDSILSLGYIRIILDLKNVPYVSSTGIGSFTYLLKKVLAQKGNIVLINVVPGVRDVLQLLGFTSFLTVKDSVEDAEAELTFVY